MPELSDQEQLVRKRRRGLVLLAIVFGSGLGLLVGAPIFVFQTRSQGPQAPTCCALRQVCAVCRCSEVEVRVAAGNNETVCREMANGHLGCIQRSLTQAADNCREMYKNGPPPAP